MQAQDRGLRYSAPRGNNYHCIRTYRHIVLFPNFIQQKLFKIYFAGTALRVFCSLKAPRMRLRSALPQLVGRVSVPLHQKPLSALGLRPRISALWALIFLGPDSTYITRAVKLSYFCLWLIKHNIGYLYRIVYRQLQCYL